MAGKELFIPLYYNWIELMEIKDTDAKKLAFIQGIIDAFMGREPPSPKDMENPAGTDYARRDGYLTARPVSDNIIRFRGGQLGNQNAIKNESKTNQERIENEDETNAGYNNINNIIINKSIDNNARSCDKSHMLELFEKFWKEYPSSCPRKYCKKQCRKKWEVIFRGAADADVLFGIIMKGLSKWKSSKMWNDNGGQYIMAPHRWLNSNSWEDGPAGGEQDDAAREPSEERKKFLEILARTEG